MQFALMIYHSPEEFDMRKNNYSDPHLGAWRAYYKALVEVGVYLGANALEVPETGTMVGVREGIGGGGSGNRTFINERSPSGVAKQRPLKRVAWGETSPVRFRKGTPASSSRKTTESVGTQSR